MRCSRASAEVVAKASALQLQDLSPLPSDLQPHPLDFRSNEIEIRHGRPRGFSWLER
jgi:hypothetical protein